MYTSVGIDLITILRLLCKLVAESLTKRVFLQELGDLPPCQVRMAARLYGSQLLEGLHFLFHRGCRAVNDLLQLCFLFARPTCCLPLTQLMVDGAVHPQSLLFQVLLDRRFRRSLTTVHKADELLAPMQFRFLFVF